MTRPPVHYRQPRAPQAVPDALERVMLLSDLFCMLVGAIVGLVVGLALGLLANIDQWHAVMHGVLP